MHALHCWVLYVPVIRRDAGSPACLCLPPIHRCPGALSIHAPIENNARLHGSSESADFARSTSLVNLDPAAVSEGIWLVINKLPLSLQCYRPSTGGRLSRLGGLWRSSLASLSSTNLKNVSLFSNSNSRASPTSSLTFPHIPMRIATFLSASCP
ncbi:hypothetical protein BD779DRAFT_225489 [Infundibulicybe gibba]|nr:hypothetical protein BD779DRAFT_225489 [Infundibulicybe gibba]